MEEIDVGQKDGATNTGSVNTSICVVNPANGSGKLNRAELATYQTSDVTLATFFGVAPKFTSRDSVYLGRVVATALTVFTDLELDVQEGDVIGGYASVRLRVGWYGSAGVVYVYQLNGNKIDGSEYTYGSYPDQRALIVYATGETVSAGNKAFMHYYKKMAGGIRC